MRSPILVYTDLNKPYILFMYTSNYAWSEILTQEHESTTEGKTITHQHPITYTNRMFLGSQLNWAALTKEAYAIDMAIKKLSFYLADAIIMLWCYHLPLKRFSKRQHWMPN